MKRSLVLVLFTLVVATMSLDDDYINALGSMLSLTKKEVTICVNKTDVTVEDLMHFDEVMQERLQLDFDDGILKVGCLLTCLCQTKEIMVGANIKIDKMKEMVRSKSRDPAQLAIRFQIFDACNEQMKGKTNECKVSLEFIVCLMNRARQYI